MKEFLTSQNICVSRLENGFLTRAKAGLDEVMEKSGLKQDNLEMVYETPKTIDPNYVPVKRAAEVKKTVTLTAADSRDEFNKKLAERVRKQKEELDKFNSEAERLDAFNKKLEE